MPKDRLWTAKDDAIRVPGWVGIPGGKHTIGLARHWHFFMDILFVINGAIFVALNFATGQWVRLVPTSWEIIPQAFSGFILYSSLQDPSALVGVSGFERYNALQQISFGSGPEGTRTPGLRHAKAALSQLSYGPKIEPEYPSI